MFKKPASNPNFFEIEEEITKWWKENRIFEKSIENRKDSKDYIFYDGPPFMSGTPHYAHLLSSIMKDIVPRYQTMKGLKVERVWGWDCHGLPIENKVEKELNLSGKKEIEAYGLERFIEKCYEWNRVGIENWKWYIEKIGRWVDIENAYRTMDQDYMESVWWSFKQVWDKGLVYKGLRTSLYSTDFSTPVSDFEVSMDPDNYQDTEDIAVFVKFELTAESKTKLQMETERNVYFVAWTTTPWTLPSNFALAVNPEAIYSFIESNEEIFILAEKRLEETMQDTPYTVLKTILGSELQGLEYNQLYSFLSGGENDFKIYTSNYVTTEDGTGVLHVAPAFGEADAEMGKEFGLSFTGDIDDEGIMNVGPWTGEYIRNANSMIRDNLKSENKLLRDQLYIHRLPYYRGNNPLIYKTQEDVFIDVQQLKEQLIKTNEEIRWVPEYFKDGRFKYILETAPDWSISRSRSWGTAMPLWRSEQGDEIVVGSRDELMELVNKSSGLPTIKRVRLSIGDDNNLENTVSKIEEFINSKDDSILLNASQEVLSQLRNKYFGETEAESRVKLIKIGEERSYYLFKGKPLNLHRPYIDEIEFTKDGNLYKRVSYTMDVWMDSGSMPYAQFHYPFNNKSKFEDSFPGDYISEYTGQIRAWFYVLHVLSNAIFGKNAFKNVLVSGVLAGTDGRKMSKSYGNYPDPKETIKKYSGDALRIYFLNGPLVSGNDTNFSELELKMQVREFMIPLWNIFSYLTTYANIHDWSPKESLAYNERKVESDSHQWDHIPFDNIDNELDAWILFRLQQTIKSVTSSLDAYTLPSAIRSIKDLIDDTSKWYIRRSRDRFAEGNPRALETLYYVLVEISKLLAPFAPFLSETIYRELVATKIPTLPESVHLTDYPSADERFFSDYAAIESEMIIVQRICEIGQTLRTVNGLKVRQPLAKLYFRSNNELISTLSPWMREIIKSELNVKEVLDVIEIDKALDIKAQEDPQLKIEIGLDTKIDAKLMEEGTVREVIRSIQACRKKSGFQQGEKVSIEYYTDDESLSQIIKNNQTKIEEVVTGVLSQSEVSSQDGFITQKINDSSLQLKLNR